MSAPAVPSSAQGHTPKYDPEYWKVVAPSKTGWVQPDFKDAIDLRNFTEPLLRKFFDSIPAVEGIVKTAVEVESVDGAKVKVVRFATKEQMESTELLPALLNIHGGGMISCDVDMFSPQIAQYAAETGVQQFSVDYRLAPEHPAPAAVHDCYAGLEWLVSHAKELHVDPARIGVMGDSAGGGLAAGTCLRARDQGLSPPIAKQILVYPMLDDRTTTRYPEDWPLHAFLNWKFKDNILAWNAYVGEDKVGKPEADISHYASPARAKSVEGLPPTYIDVGGLDLFRDECLEYASRIAAANIDLEFHLYPGIPHGFESAGDIPVVKRARENRVRAVRSL
ncbi:putative arylesterase monooxygenase protein [Phaeoacremonium minimum UCRPA7]|uniref:Putative arylesterase monooxygenase protein n=1 Tax=Phaeoacremonium minimum (strain UCR-PA7) TaxID=1286976 RepID=R8BRG2_PHAM7|nr:putative arylesterase monooxygenase protein [Phaeoacremonium minimum UCRPA7]EOO01962.1 putative arylesterase monooxygenase protein [Phaeoacremonium minimum UCRPA7]